MVKKLYQHIAGSVDARLRCALNGNTEWKHNHGANLQTIASDILPSGAGIDNGTTIDLDRSRDEKLVLSCSYHHMNEAGYYDGWTQHTIIVRASLVHGIRLSISGPNRNDIKDYLHEVFYSVLTTDYEHVYDAKTETSTYTRSASDAS